MPKVLAAEMACLDEIGGEPLEGSGFEDETPDLRFVAGDFDSLDAAIEEGHHVHE